MTSPPPHDASLNNGSAVADLTDVDQVKAWISSQLSLDRKSNQKVFLDHQWHQVKADGRVEVMGSVNLGALPRRLKPYSRLPVNFDIIHGDLYTTEDIESFAGFPDKVRLLNLSASSITSWQGCPRYISDILVMGSRLASVIDPVTVKDIEVTMINLGELDEYVRLPKLAFFPLTESVTFTTAMGLPAKHIEELKAFFLPRLKLASRNRAGALWLQQELIDGGYEEWA